MWKATRPHAIPAGEAVPAPPAAAPSTSDMMSAALTAFEAEDYAAAVRHADAVLARDAAHEQARQLRDRARTSAAAVDRGVKNARALLDKGRFEEASRAAGEVLGVAPGNREAKRIMEEGAARSRGHGAEEARSQVARARAAARSAGAQRLAPEPYLAATAAERDAQRLYRPDDRETQRSSSTKPAASSAAPRSPPRTKSAAREARARRGAAPHPKSPTTQAARPPPLPLPPAPSRLPSGRADPTQVPAPAPPAPSPAPAPASAPAPTLRRRPKIRRRLATRRLPTCCRGTSQRSRRATSMHSRACGPARLRKRCANNSRMRPASAWRSSILTSRGRETTRRSALSGDMTS